MVFSGCVATIENVANVPIDFKYNTKNEPGPKSNKMILLLSPDIVFAKTKQSVSPFGMSAEEQKQGSLAEEYGTQFIENLQNDVEAFFTQQGYKVVSIDGNDTNDISFAQKKDGYLIVQISGRLDVGVTVTKSDSDSDQGNPLSKGVRTTKGFYSPNGNIAVRFLEPLTGTIIESFKIDVTRFKINEPYTLVRRVNTGGLLGGYMSPDDKSDFIGPLTKTFNQIYKGIVEKIDNKINYHTIDLYEKDIAEIKKNKRY